jgi:hypothetical protein
LFEALETSDPFCTYYSEFETRPVNIFKFGDIPQSDSCTEILYECILDETVRLDDPESNTPWFKLEDTSVLFYLTSDPIYQDSLI